MIYLKRFLFSISFCLISFFIYYGIFKSIYISENIIIKYAIHPFNICTEQPLIWNIIKISSIVFYIFNTFMLFFIFSKKIFYKKVKNLNDINYSNYHKEIKNSLFLNIGFDNYDNLISIPEKSLYQNILITGTIRNW